MRLSLIMLLFIGVLVEIRCGLINPLVDVSHHAQDSTMFNILPLQLQSTSQKSKIETTFLYQRKLSGKKLITCTVKIENEKEQTDVISAQILGEEMQYYISTFDKLPSQRIKKGKFLHTISFYLPYLDFNKMMQKENIKLKINDQIFETHGKRWSKIGEQVKSEHLLDTSSMLK